MIRTEALGKSFRDRRRGVVHAVEDLTFDCQPGEVFGLLGPNGAGKTTALRILSTALRPTTGRAEVMGFDIEKQPQKVRASIGFLSANMGLYPRLTPRETLLFFGRLYGLAESETRRRTGELASLFQMEDFLDRPCDKLSLGMKQKVNIARSLIHTPPVIVLDEPTAGIDVLTSRSIVEFIRESRRERKTVILSTHIMSEVERLCDRVAIIHGGRLRFLGTLDDLRLQRGNDLEEAFVSIVSEESA